MFLTCFSASKITIFYKRIFHFSLLGLQVKILKSYMKIYPRIIVYGGDLNFNAYTEHR